MMVQKLLYCGYINDFSQSEAELTIKRWPQDCIPCEQFLKLVKNRRNNESSKKLQDYLVLYFKKNLKFFDIKRLIVRHQDFTFGKTYRYYNHISEVIGIDCQDEYLLGEVVGYLRDVALTLPNSMGRKIYIDVQIAKEKPAITKRRNAYFKKDNQGAASLAVFYLLMTSQPFKLKFRNDAKI